MPTYKADNGKWYAICWYSDWQGNRKQKCKRGFATKRDAQEWERQFLMQEQVLTELQQLTVGTEPTPDMLKAIQMIAQVMDGMKNEPETAPNAKGAKHHDQAR